MINLKEKFQIQKINTIERETLKRIASYFTEENQQLLLKYTKKLIYIFKKITYF